LAQQLTRRANERRARDEGRRQLTIRQEQEDNKQALTGRPGQDEGFQLLAISQIQTGEDQQLVIRSKSDEEQAEVRQEEFERARDPRLTAGTFTYPSMTAVGTGGMLTSTSTTAAANIAGVVARVQQATENWSAAAATAAWAATAAVITAEAMESKTTEGISPGMNPVTLQIREPITTAAAESTTADLRRVRKTRAWGAAGGPSISTPLDYTWQSCEAACVLPLSDEQRADSPRGEPVKPNHISLLLEREKKAEKDVSDTSGVVSKRIRRPAGGRQESAATVFLNNFRPDASLSLLDGSGDSQLIGSNDTTQELVIDSEITRTVTEKPVHYGIGKNKKRMGPITLELDQSLDYSRSGSTRSDISSKQIVGQNFIFCASTPNTRSGH
jgi:hypothetical protein